MIAWCVSMIRKVFITSYCLTVIHSIIEGTKKKNEVGGALVGFQHKDSLTITHASMPGPKAKMKKYSVVIDGEYTTDFCNNINRCSNHSLYYIGDWHTHLSTNLTPSHSDLKAMKIMASYLPKEIEFTLITFIFNHFSPDNFVVYNYGKEKKLEKISYEIIDTPEWVINLNL